MNNLKYHYRKYICLIRYTRQENLIHMLLVLLDIPMIHVVNCMYQSPG